jgi:hypothetical protein
MGVSHNVRVGAFLKIQLREIDISVPLWDCGHGHINSSWLRQDPFCKQCGNALTKRVITQRRYPHVWTNEFITDEGLRDKVTFPEIDYKKTGLVFMLDNEWDEVGSCFVDVPDEGFNAITMADMAQTTAQFENNHAYLIRTLKRHPAVVTAEVVFGVLRYYS